MFNKILQQLPGTRYRSDASRRLLPLLQSLNQAILSTEVAKKPDAPLGMVNSDEARDFLTDCDNKRLSSTGPKPVVPHNHAVFILPSSPIYNASSLLDRRRQRLVRSANESQKVMAPRRRFRAG